jgi:hypothetical protein
MEIGAMNKTIFVMAGINPAIHFPEAYPSLHRFWKMEGRHEGGHDG